MNLDDNLTPRIDGAWRAYIERIRTPVEPRLISCIEARVRHLLGHDGPSCPPESDVERWCVDLTEQIVIDPHGVSREHLDRLAARIGHPAVVALTLAITTTEATERRVAVLAAVIGEEMENGNAPTASG